jgi:lycopene cyclase domain-containing protein
MTYFGFLCQFLVVPLAILLIITLIDSRRGQTVRGFLNGRAIWMAIACMLIAIIYTTPWDNYLVATGVWYYNPNLISGLILGWVPIEEYIFFVLETILTGLWWWFLARRLKRPREFKRERNIRIFSTAILGAIWLGAAYILISSWKPGTYLSLILVWALPAIMLQIAYGADILWHHRKLVTLVILPVFLYFGSRLLAISSGTWTIDAPQSLGIIIGALPVEEAVFLSTVILIGFGSHYPYPPAKRWIIWEIESSNQSPD